MGRRSRLKTRNTQNIPHMETCWIVWTEELRSAQLICFRLKRMMPLQKEESHNGAAFRNPGRCVGSTGLLTHNSRLRKEIVQEDLAGLIASRRLRLKPRNTQNIRHMETCSIVWTEELHSAL